MPTHRNRNLDNVDTCEILASYFSARSFISGTWNQLHGPQCIIDMVNVIIDQGGIRTLTVKMNELPLCTFPGVIATHIILFENSAEIYEILFKKFRPLTAVNIHHSLWHFCMKIRFRKIMLCKWQINVPF